MGIYKNLDDAARSVVLEKTYKPNKQNHGVYKNYLEIFEKLSTRFSEEFEAIATLQQTNNSGQAG